MSAATPGSRDAAFVAWLAACGFRLDGVRLHRFADTGRGVQATRELRKGDVLFRVEPGFVLSPSPSLRNSGLGPWEQLAIAIMAENAAGRASRWWPYLASLPDGVDLPSRWGRDDARWHACTAARPRGEARRAFFCAVAPYLSTHGPGLGLPPSSHTLPAFHRASSLVSAYAFTLPGGATAMVPLADSLNARTGATNASLTVASGGALEMVATDPIAPGAEVFNTYGLLSNAELLSRYGYVDRPNRHDVALLRVTALLPPGRPSSAALVFLGDHGLLPPSGAWALPAYRRGVNMPPQIREAMEVARVLRMHPSRRAAIGARVVSGDPPLPPRAGSQSFRVGAFGVAAAVGRELRSRPRLSRERRLGGLLRAVGTGGVGELSGGTPRERADIGRALASGAVTQCPRGPYGGSGGPLRRLVDAVDVRRGETRILLMWRLRMQRLAAAGKQRRRARAQA